MKRVPSLYIQHEEAIYSNYDHEINNTVVDDCKHGYFYADYPGRYFMAYVWFEIGKWFAEVWQYAIHKETIEADSIVELKRLVCEKYSSR